MANTFQIEDLSAFPFDAQPTPAGVPSNVAMRPALIPSSIMSLLASRPQPPSNIRPPQRQMGVPTVPMRADRVPPRPLLDAATPVFAPPPLPTLPRGMMATPASAYPTVPRGVMPANNNCYPPNGRMPMVAPSGGGGAGGAIPMTLRVQPTKPQDVPCRGQLAPGSAAPPYMRQAMTRFPFFQGGQLGGFGDFDGYDPRFPRGSRAFAGFDGGGGKPLAVRMRSAGGRRGTRGVRGFDDGDLNDDLNELNAIRRASSALQNRGAKPGKRGVRGIEGLGTNSFKAPGTECPATGSWENYCDCMFDSGSDSWKKCRSSWPFAPWTIVGKLIGGAGGTPAISPPTGSSGGTSTAMPNTEQPPTFNFPGGSTGASGSGTNTALLVGAGVAVAAGIAYALTRKGGLAGLRRRRNRR